MRYAFAVVLCLFFTVISGDELPSIGDIIQKQGAVVEPLQPDADTLSENSLLPGQTAATEIRVLETGDSIRVIITPPQKVDFKYDLLKGREEDRVYLDMHALTADSFKLPEPGKGSFLHRIRIGKKNGGVRLVLDTGKVEQYNVLVMESPWRIVVDYFGKKILAAVTVPEMPKKKAEEPKTVSPALADELPQLPVQTAKKEEKQKPFVVVIDAGHGGKDPGAVHKKMYEKDITLKLAKLIEKRSKDKKHPVSIKLTRSKDVYIALEERAVIANRLEGDLFISLHVNANRDKEVSGMEIYHLDNRRDEYSDKLAMVENQISDSNSLLNTILVDMTMSLYIADSLTLAESFGGWLEKAGKPYSITLRDWRRGALFYVLVGARMPSMLVEIGYLSNAEDRKNLKNDKFLEALADAILAAADSAAKHSGAGKP